MANLENIEDRVKLLEYLVHRLCLLNPNEINWRSAISECLVIEKIKWTVRKFLVNILTYW